MTEFSCNYNSYSMSASSRFAVAVHALTLMASRGDEPLNSGQIAASVNTNAVVIRRILCALSNAGLVTTQAGAAGGSRLARPPAEITLLDVRRALDEGGAFVLHRRTPDKRCLVGMTLSGRWKTCSTRSPWQSRACSQR